MKELYRFRQFLSEGVIKEDLEDVEGELIDAGFYFDDGILGGVGSGGAGYYDNIVGSQQGDGIYGYGGNSTLTGFTSGGNGTIILRIPKMNTFKKYIEPNTISTLYPVESAQIYDNTPYWYYNFKNNNTMTFNTDTICDVLIVGGGGGGSAYGGGGSSGGLVYATGITASKNMSYDITVGQGGASGTDGNISSAFGITVVGGKGATTTKGASDGTADINTFSSNIFHSSLPSSPGCAKRGV